MSEPNAGSDLASLSTKAERHDGHFVVNGQKVWTSGAHESDYCMCYVRTDPEAPKHRVSACSSSTCARPGITCRPLPELTDPHHVDFNEVFFTDVEVPGENLLGELNHGWAVSQGALRHERAMLWIMNVGRIRAYAQGAACALPDAPTPAAGKSATIPRIAEAIGRLATDTEAMRCLGYRGFAKATRGEMPPEHLVLEALLQRGGAAGQPPGGRVPRARGAGPRRAGAEPVVGVGPGPLRAGHGGVGGHETPFYDGAWAVQYLRSFSVTIAGGTSEIQRNIVAERGLLGLPRG